MSWTWEEFRALPSETVTVDIHCVTKWSKLDTAWTGVSLDTLLDGVETSAEYVHGVQRRRLHDEPAARGPHAAARPGSPSRYDGEPLEPEHGGPARLLVPHLYFWKSAKWVRGLELRDRGRARLLGGLRLPQLRRPVAGAALPGRLTWQVADGRRARRRDGARAEHRARPARLARPPRRPARRRPADRRGRLPGAAQLLDRLGARGRLARAHRRAARRRRGLAVPRRRARPATSSSCAARSAATSSGRRRSAGHCCCSPAARASCRCARCCATAPRSSSTVPVRLLYSARTLDEVIYRDELARTGRATRSTFGSR